MTRFASHYPLCTLPARRRARGSASRALQDALQSVHIDAQLLKQLVEEYAACRGLEPLPASSAAAEGSEEEMQTDVQQQADAQQQTASPGKAERLRQSKVGSKRSAAAAAAEAEAGGGQPLELPAELSEHQLRRVVRRLERLLSAGQADEVRCCTAWAPGCWLACPCAGRYRESSMAKAAAWLGRIRCYSGMAAGLPG